MDPILQFREIIDRAKVAERHDPIGWELARFGAEIVQLVRSHPKSQRSFEIEFISLVDSDPGGPFLEFCMHALRWRAVWAAIEQRHSAAIARNDFRAEPYYRYLLEAFREDWDDAKDVYRDYFKNGT